MTKLLVFCLLFLLPNLHVSAGVNTDIDEDEAFLNQGQVTKDAVNNVQLSAAELEAKLLKNPQDIKTRNKLSEHFAKEKQYKRVIDLLDPFASDLQGQGLIRLAQAFKAEKRYADEVRICKLLVAHYPNSSKAHHLLGLAHRDNKQEAEAIVSLRKSIELQPKEHSTYEDLLQIFINQKNNYESRLVINDMIKKFGRKPKYLSSLCKIYADDTFIDEAIHHCGAAIKNDPNNPDNHGYLARSYKDKGDRPAAEKILKSSTKRFTKSEFLHRMAGDFFFEQKNYNESLRYYSIGVLADRNVYESQIGFARSAFQLAKYEEALIGFENACKLNREALKFFKEAAATLRIERNYGWESKYNEVLYRCQG